MDFKYYWKNVRSGPMSQKSYEHWVMNDGVDPEDGDGGQQNRGQQQNRQENGAGGQVDKQVDGGGGGERHNQRVRGRGRDFWGRGRRKRGYRGRFQGYGMGNQFYFHIF